MATSAKRATVANTQRWIDHLSNRIAYPPPLALTRMPKTKRNQTQYRDSGKRAAPISRRPATSGASRRK